MADGGKLVAEPRGHGHSSHRSASHASHASPRQPGAGTALALLTGRLLGSLVNRSTAQLVLLWLWISIGFGLVYWLVGPDLVGGLSFAGGSVQRDLPGLGTAIYFSFVTALSIGYGDVTPVGMFRLLAILEGAAGLLLFGAIVSKLVSQRQEEMAEDTHHIAYEERLGRVRTNLRLLIDGIQDLAERCGKGGESPDRMGPRVESTVAGFVGEMKTIHDLLYRPRHSPDEESLESILALLASGMRELNYLLECLPPSVRHLGGLRTHLVRIGALAEGICGECVPREYAADLKSWMDDIRELARGLG